MINEYGTTFDNTTLFYYNKVKKKRKFTTTIERNMKLGGIAPFEVAERLET